MKRNIDKLDYLIAVALAAFVFLLAWVWAYPYPHPSLWSLLSEFRVHVSCEMLGKLGRLSLGVFAGLSYILLRIFWFRNLEVEDEYPDKFFFNRSAPICGAVIFSVFPVVWRSAQFFSPEFVFVILEMIAIIAWLQSRGRGDRLLRYSFAYFILAFVAAFNPFAFAFFAYAMASDVIGRWQRSLVHDQQEDDLAKNEDSVQEQIFSAMTSVVGFVGGIIILARYAALHNFTWSLPTIFSTWWGAWLAAFDKSLISPFMIAIAGLAIVAIVVEAFGRRIRSVGEYGRTMAIALSSLLALITLVFVSRANDGDARKRLALIRDYVQSVVRDAGDVRWFFSDGRLVDILRYEFTRAGKSTLVMDVTNAPNPQEADLLRKHAPDRGEREIFAAGGSEVFRAWARERPERLAESAWFTGGGILKMFGKVKQRTCGCVLRAEPAKDKTAAYDEADAWMSQFAAKAMTTVSIESNWGRIFGGVDRMLAEKFDAVLWRIARQASAQAELQEAAGNVNGAAKLRDMVSKLNARNATLYAQGEVLERMLQTISLVPTSREALEIALKRADFVLAQRYANEVLAISPDDSRANFALGMVNLQSKEYFRAVRNFERVLKTLPNEPATLNNLALAYLKLNRLESAKEAAEKALKANPNSKEVKNNLAEINKAMQEHQ